MEKMSSIFLILNKIRKLYDCAGRAQLVEKISGGEGRHSFIVESKGRKFFLKQYRFSNIHKIKEIQKIKFLFAKGGIPVILPVKNKAGDFIFKFHGKFYSLFPYIDGQIVRGSEQPKKILESAGAMLAKLHFLGNKSRFRSKFIHKYELLNLKGVHIIVHGDYSGANIFYDNKDKIIAVFDWEKAEIVPRAFDVARSMHLMCFSNDFGRNNFKNAEIFVRAYNKVYPLAKGELMEGIKAYYLKETLKADILSARVLKTASNWK